jgi:4-azaleucine resistance transporter AzlC
MVAGIAAISAGMDSIQAISASLLIFAGASQLVAYGLMQQGAPVAIIVLAALTVNLRFLLYSAALAPHMRPLTLLKRAINAYLMTDQAYAFAQRRYAEHATQRYPHHYYLGTALPLFVTWQLSTIAGVLLGSGIPDSWGLDFAVPLCFIALLVPTVKDRPSLLAAITGGGIAVLAGGLPWKLSIVIGAICGIAAAVISKGWKRE